MNYTQYHAERSWGIFVAGMIIWLYFLGYPWMPPIAFSDASATAMEGTSIKITAGQWFWILEDGGYGQGPKIAGVDNNESSLRDNK